MNVPQIRLESNFIRLGLNIERPMQEISQPPAVLSIQQPKAILEIETAPGKLTIDQTKAREDVDLKSIGRRIEEFAQNGYQDWLKGLERRAAQGTELMRIENGGNPIAYQAKENSEGLPKQFNIGWIPSHNSVKVNYEPAKVNVKAQPQKPKIDVEIRKPIHNYTPGKVTAEILEKNSLSFDFINLTI
ncbi:hypothetical protein J7I93_03100 [Bacillus sp. ISL-47]|uniref:DUF6470 family protein n=1 Tax=Bacillus sp. ISL-47 TaxID=2819130 RepID=UPI001BE9F297|nr:DUF6470 family protein [Bacillus sp. ISL-47]MBT2687165.1 hypothetical protein [Bacillus sp. ISL-47]MBT2709765.1 hypothetical protein [Pseudomonas sp. ISL-84]